MIFTILRRTHRSKGLGSHSSQWCTQASNICIAIMIQVAFPASVLLQLSRHPQTRHRVGLWETWQIVYFTKNVCIEGCTLVWAAYIEQCSFTLAAHIEGCSFICAVLTHWDRVTHIWVGNLTIIGSDNGLSPGRRRAITWTNAGILLIGPLETNFNEILIEIQAFSLNKMRLKMSSAKCCSFRLGLNVLTEGSRLT